MEILRNGINGYIQYIILLFISIIHCTQSIQFMLSREIFDETNSDAHAPAIEEMPIRFISA